MAGLDGVQPGFEDEALRVVRNGTTRVTILNNGDVIVHTGDVYVRTKNVIIEQLDLDIKKGDSHIRLGDEILHEGDVRVIVGDVRLGPGNISTKGKVIVDTDIEVNGKITAISGFFSPVPAIGVHVAPIPFPVPEP